MIDIETASTKELAMEMKRRCEAQKECFIAFWGCPDTRTLSSLYCGAMLPLIGHLVHLQDVLRQDMLDESRNTERDDCGEGELKDF